MVPAWVIFVTVEILFSFHSTRRMPPHIRLVLKALVQLESLYEHQRSLQIHLLIFL